jgi:hypothetical protein
MKRSICLLLPWLLLPAACSNDTRAARTQLADSYAPLLSRLDPGSDMIVLVDVAGAAKLLNESLDEIQQAPLVAKNPALLQMWKMQRTTLDTMLASAKVSAGVDPLNDLFRAVVGLRLREGSPPGAVVVVSGKFPPDLPQKLEPRAVIKSMGGQDVWEAPDGMGLAVVGGNLFLFAPMAEYPALLKAKHDPKGLLKRHPDLLASMQPGLLLRFSMAVPAWVRSMLPEGQAGVSTLKGLEHVEIDVGTGLRFTARAQDDRTAENLLYFAEGWKELMLGGRNLMRAYIFFIMGLELQHLAGMPPQFAGVFENRQAIMETMDAWMGEYPVPPKVVLKDRVVTLTAGKQALIGNVFVFGILAAIAIPAFIQYIRRAEAAEAEAAKAEAESVPHVDAPLKKY